MSLTPAHRGWQTALMRIVLALPLVFLACSADARPSVTLVVMDDAHAADLDHMPRTWAHLGEAVVFDAAFTPLPWCVPSRAALLSGRTPWTTGIRSNADTPRFDPSDTIATRLHAKGYRTGMVGKYLNKFAGAQPPGWDTWFALRKHGEYGREQARVLMAEADTFRDDSRPFFLYLAPVHPHGPIRGPIECEDSAPAPLGVDPTSWSQRMSALCGLDELVAHLIENRRANEYLILVSDNGWNYATTGKGTLDLDSAHVPLVVWGPGVVPGHRREMVSLVDLSATVLHLAGAKRKGLDGQSFRRLLRGSTRPWTGKLTIEGTGR